MTLATVCIPVCMVNSDKQERSRIVQLRIIQQERLRIVQL